ncbi:preprotein translocase subunit YajC [Candidatus Laterigemmans baculatus]|uniref:preprotein translocase subunit YajC n=1 Tax=Candidatus Laterigemmans baculatus TaxID=2770505 RepID=UPI0013DC74BE|nr:preprotein translocase subunit YajC [Candidatus Laterigemmans baculatus]
MSELFLPAVADTILPATLELVGGFTGLLAQAAGEAPGAAGEAAGEAAAEPNFFQSVLRNPVWLVAGLALLFYVMILLPEKRRQTEVMRMRAELKKNDRILTSGGIYGTVVGTSPDSDEVTLRVDDSNNTRIRIARSAIATKLNSSKDEASG